MSHEKKTSEYAALMDLFGRVAHDLRGPAAITTGVIEELQSRDGAEADAAYFAMARRGLAGILRIADRLEMVAQLENGALQLDRSPLDATELLRSAGEDAKSIQKRKAITVTLDIPEGLRANADRRWLSAAIAEIIANGIKHAKTSVKVAATFDDGKLTIVTHDDGRGFSDEALAGLNGPRFVRSSARAGLGISLNMARDVAQAHGGDLRVVKSADGGHVEIDLAEK